jgi:formate/nitrite transporter FocA (FNT family)
VTYLVFAGELPWSDFWMDFAGPTLAGNIIGGSFIFALISHAQIRSESGSAKVDGPEDDQGESKKD